MIAKFACLSFGLATFVIGAIDTSVWIALIGGGVTIVTSILLYLTVVSNNRTKRMELAMQEERDCAKEGRENIKEIKRATDGMNTAAVKAAKEVGTAEGKESERVKNVEAQANVDKGKAQQAAQEK